jgi:hypothetical protein
MGGDPTGRDLEPKLTPEPCRAVLEVFMTSPYTPDPVMHVGDYDLPDDGDDPWDAATFNTTFEELCDGQAFLSAKVGVGGIEKIKHGDVATMQAWAANVTEVFMLLATGNNRPGLFVLYHPGTTIAESDDIIAATAKGAGWYWWRHDHVRPNQIIDTGELYSVACDLENANASTSFVSLFTSGSVEIDGLTVGDIVELTIGPFEVYSEGVYGNLQIGIVDDATGGTLTATSSAQAASPAALTIPWRYVKAGVASDAITVDLLIAGDGDPFHAVAMVGAKRFVGTYRVIRP